MAHLPPGGGEICKAVTHKILGYRARLDILDMAQTQLELPLDGAFALGEDVALWTPRDIWVRLTQRMLSHFGEDRRVEYKGASKVDFDAFATYLSAFSNTPDGGVIVFGVDNTGNVSGCDKLTADALNKIENCHLKLCPQARPEFKRISAVIGNRKTFCVAVYIPYIGRLVETNKAEAWIRFGDTKHRMSEEEKRDFRATRQELSFEMELAPYQYPDEFDLRIIRDFCDNFRQREAKLEWTDEEILIDRHLARVVDGKFTPLNSLILLAAKDPRKTIPGCRVRIQRFSTDAEGVGNEYNPIRDKFIEGNIVEQIRGASSAIDDVIHDVTWLNDEGKFVTTPEYPRWAWFEALVNACVHRSYSFSGTEITIKFFPSRMEVESPGGFVPPVNEETIYSTRATRNYHFMDAVRYLGYARMAREGTRRIRQSMSDWGLPDPQFKQEALHGVVVRVTLKNDHESRKRTSDRDVAQFFGVDVWKTLQEHEIKIIAYTYRNQLIQVSEASRLTGRTWSTSKKDLDRLTRKGLLLYSPGDFQRDPKSHYVINKMAGGIFS